ncbi:putative exported protein [Sorangium cellulosum So ce56]|uniref:Exported protein n=1 Tax=Sorangium cellulosum (strain So ce56) TaxID=448385 RepID=A9G8Z5_SORC5|nr:DUF1552 domain-containing protein [Sorangium cellulosum]CAN99091.1 putative exported protein [Sorangium cellulosum So ce56]
MRFLETGYKKRELALGRRIFLKALGAGIAAPLAFRMSNLALAEPSSAPVRLFIYFVPHGMPMEYAEPYGSGADFLKGSTVLSPLAPFGKYINVCRGLGINGFNNHEAVSGVLTGVKDGAGVDSVDHTIAQALGVEAYNLGANPYRRYQDGTGFDKNSYLIQHGGVWVRPTEDPAAAAAAMLGAVGGGQQGGGSGPEADEVAFRNEALGLTERQLERMQSALSGLTKEQNKLAVHLESVRSLKAAADRPVMNGCSSKPALPALDALAGKSVFEQENLRRVVDAHLEVAANAMVCGTARVVTMQNLWVNCDLPMSFDGGPGSESPYHGATSHAREPPGRMEFATVQSWFFARLAEKLLTLLDQPDPLDPGNTVLHNSLIYVCSEIGDGADHNSNVHDVYLGNQIVHSYLPAILIGNAGGRIASRGVVDVDTDHVNMLATLGDAMGVSINRFGAQSAQPIQELKS